MKTLLGLFLVLVSLNTFAASTCSKWENRADYVKAITVVATEAGYTYDQVCNNPRIWDVEAQPSRIILRDGTIVPHVRVQFHYEYYSCLYMVSKETWLISEGRCYSGM